MGARSRILASATAVIMLAVAMPASASPATALRSTGDVPVPRIFHAMLRLEPDPSCNEVRAATDSSTLLDWWRQWWGAATSRRVARQPDAEAAARAPFYLRSPMMSGFFGWGEPNECDETRAAAQRNASPLPLPPLRADSDTATLGPPRLRRW